MNHILRSVLLKRSLLTISAVIFLFGVLSLLHPFRRDVRVFVETALARVHSVPNTPFPTVSFNGLTPIQQKIITISKAEYAKKPVSFDSTVLVYTQGNKEAWCADYVSWVMEEAGVPFGNPNSGSWRIPGVYTLKQYYQDNNRYQKAGNYIPKVGDVAIYMRDSGHTNIVLSAHNGVMTTIGGNETGHLRIHTQKYAAGTAGLDGFGLLPGQTSS